MDSSPLQTHCDKLCKISDISWLQWFEDNVISLKLQRLSNDLGTFPPSSLFDKSMLMIDDRFPMALETAPFKLLEPSLRNSR